MLLPFLRGLGLGASLIIAIGAQNAFVLRQGLRREKAVLVAAICACCDAVLITSGALGVGGVIAHWPLLARLTSLGGAVFLLYYGLRAFRSARHPGSLDASAAPLPRGSVIASTLSVSLLNPHVYLDTVVLVGGLAAQYAALPRIFFTAGAISASCLWFFSLALGAAHLAPVFRRPHAWQVLDCFVGAVMWVIAVSLIAPLLSLKSG
jgi:L-lysine exporter family protein LysE/ArgO